MFKELGGIMGLLNNKGKIQDEMQKFQQTISQLTAEGMAGGGLITVKVNGQMAVLSVKISDDAMKLNDREPDSGGQRADELGRSVDEESDRLGS